MHPVVYDLVDRLGDVVQAAHGEFRFNCPKPHDDYGGRTSYDTKYRLYVNPEIGKWICYRCGRGGSIGSLLKYLGIETAAPSLSKWDEFVLSLREVALGEHVAEDDSPQPVDYPCEVFPVEPRSPAFNYLVSDRGFSPRLLADYQPMQGTGYWRDRVFFPVFDGKLGLVFWSARLFRGEHPAKYLGAKAPRTRLLFNLERIERDGLKEIDICEGVLSAVACGLTGVATFGKYVSPGQISRLASLAGDPVEMYYIALDGDARKQALDVARRLEDRVRGVAQVRVVDLPPRDDPASLDAWEYAALREEAKPPASLSLRVRHLVA